MLYLLPIFFFCFTPAEATVLSWKLSDVKSAHEEEISLWEEEVSPGAFAIRAALTVEGMRVCTEDVTVCTEPNCCPKGAISACGDAVAIWMQEGKICSARLAKGTTVWQKCLNFVSGELDEVTLAPTVRQVAMDSEGDAVAVFEANQQIVAARLVKGARRWVLATRPLSSVGAYEMPTVAMSASGDAVAIWIDYERGGVVQGARLLPKSLTWLRTSDLFRRTGACSVSLAMNQFGDAIAVIPFWGCDLECAVLNHGKEKWCATEAIAKGKRNLFSADVFVDPNGSSATAFWKDGCAKLLNPFAPQPIQGIEANYIVNHFPTQTEVSIFLFWLPSATTEIDHYRIERNGEAIATVSASKNLVYEDHGLKTGESYTYALIAVTSNGQESAPVCITVP